MHSLREIAPRVRVGRLGPRYPRTIALGAAVALVALEAAACGAAPNPHWAQDPSARDPVPTAQPLVPATAAPTASIAAPPASTPPEPVTAGEPPMMHEPAR
jgi:hypothetical protein